MHSQAVMQVSLFLARFSPDIRRRILRDALNNLKESEKLIPDSQVLSEIMPFFRERKVRPGSQASLGYILHRSAELCGVSEAAVMGTSRKQGPILARQVAQAVIRRWCMISYPAIARLFRCDHTTILSNVTKVYEHPNVLLILRELNHQRLAQHQAVKVHSALRSPARTKEEPPEKEFDVMAEIEESFEDTHQGGQNHNH